jgi:hypothetical protein
MRLNAPSSAVWLIAVVVGALGVLLRLRVVSLPGLGVDAFWLVTAGFALLVVATALRRL